MIIYDIEKKILEGYEISFDEALNIYKNSKDCFLDLFASASRIREKYKGKNIILCSIVSAKSGNCSEDCSFCAQSAHYKTNAPVYPLMNPDEIIKRAEDAYKSGASEFSVVTSGKEIRNENDFNKLLETFKKYSGKFKIPSCASLGALTYEKGKKLRDAGLTNYHHNLETAESFYQNICSTHTFKERIETVKTAKSLGFKVCSGGIFGMGESEEQRIELAFTLKELNVDSVPMNFLNPIPGTPLEGMTPMKPLEILRLIALYRFILPSKDIIICGGREVNLRSLQSMIFFAGANGTLMGNYLTTKGNSPEDDMQMIEDAELKPEVSS
ncbi:MAG: biotin synthase BioB [Candidatus Schekmanbacteria bacterium]|nr:MAG: biotin synthase BioB [Candidatus Schekmanbacteria bacterium]